MTRRGRGVVVATLVALALVLPGVASAHAYLVRTVPTPSGILNAPPPVVALTFDEAVEPRFAIISVTNAAGRQETTAPVSRSPANPDTLVVPLRPHLSGGLVPRLLARDLRRRAPRPGRVHLRDRSERGASAPVPGAVDRGDGDDAQAAGRSLAGLPHRDDRDRPVRAADRDRPAAAPAGRGDEPPGRLDRHGGVLGPRSARDPGLPRDRDLRSTRSGRTSRSGHSSRCSA